MEEASTNRIVRLYLYFWLPLDKDIFGFEDRENAPLNITSKSFRMQRDQTLFDRLVEYFKDKGVSDISNASFLDRSSTIANQELGLDRFQIQFVYKVSNIGPGSNIPIIKDLNNISGIFVVYSNGLYVWQLDLLVSKKVLDETNDFRNQIRTFLSNYFLNVVMEVFDANLSKIPPTFIDNQTNLKPIAQYNGILVDPQINLLLNTLLDEEIIPQRHFKSEKFEEINVSKLRLSSMLDSIGLFTWDIPENDDYFDREYSAIGKIQRKSFTFLVDPSIRKGNLNPYIKPCDLGVLASTLGKELFISRLAYSAMQQFIEVTNTFTLPHYENGIEFCLQNLSDLAEVQLKQQSPELRFQSMEKSKANITFLQSYYMKLKTKDPRLTKLHKMIEVFLQTNVPFSIQMDIEHITAGSIGGFDEWIFSRHQLEQSLIHQKEKVNALNYSLNSIRDALSVIRDETRNRELSTQTKLEEIAADKDSFNYSFLPKETIEFGGGAERFIGTLAILLAVVSMLVDVGIAVIGPILASFWSSLIDTFKFSPIAQAVIVIIVYTFIVIYSLRLFRFISKKHYLAKFVSWFIPEMDRFKEGDMMQKNIAVLEQRFENSALRLKLRVKKHKDLSEFMFKINSSMPSIVTPQNTGLTVRSSFYVAYEVLSSSLSQYKYDFHTEPEEDHDDIYYTVHIEIDEDMLGEEMVITNLRITINCKETYLKDSHQNNAFRQNSDSVAKVLLRDIVESSELETMGDVF